MSDYIESVVEEGGMSLPTFENMTFDIVANAESVKDSDHPFLKRITVAFNTPDSEVEPVLRTLTGDVPCQRSVEESHGVDHHLARERRDG